MDRKEDALGRHRRTYGAIPFIPQHQTKVRSRFFGEHRDEFQQVAVRIVEVYRDGGHPSEYLWLFAAIDAVAALDALSFQERHGAFHVLQFYFESEMPPVNLVRRQLTNAKHGLARRSHPIEQSPRRLIDPANLQAQQIFVEMASAREIGYRNVRFVEILNDGHERSVALGWRRLPPLGRKVMLALAAADLFAEE